jgi:uncharacterized membrane protein
VANHQQTAVYSQHRRDLLDLIQGRRSLSSRGPSHIAFKIHGVPYSAFIWRSGVSRDSTVIALMVGRWVDKRMVLFQADEAQELADYLDDPEAWDVFVFFVEGWMAYVGEVPTPPLRRAKPGQPGWKPNDPVRDDLQ